MFHRFSRSVRSVVFRALDNAESEGGKFIEPGHILIALTDLHPELLERLFGYRVDIRAVQCELAPLPKPSNAAHSPNKMRFSEQSKRVMLNATEEARAWWKRWEAPRRGEGSLLPEDLAYWEARLGQTLRITKRPGWFGRWILRRTWEVDERHILLGMLKCVDCPAASVLTKRGVTLEAARQLLYAKAK